MSLPYRQQWKLRRIGRALRQSDPDLTAMLTQFDRSGAAQKLPGWEQLRTSPGPVGRALLWPVKSAAFLVAFAAGGGRTAARRAPTATLRRRGSESRN
jgi:hypothetical protein